MTSRAGQLVRLLGSDRDGEALNACRALGRLLKDNGHDWHWLADLADRHMLPVGDLLPWQAQARALLERGGPGMSLNVRSFLNSMAKWPTPPSPRQRAWLDSLDASIRERAA